MKCPNCDLEISEVDKICPFCKYTIINDENNIYEKQNHFEDTAEIDEIIDISESEDDLILADDSATDIDHNLENDQHLTQNTDTDEDSCFDLNLNISDEKNDDITQENSNYFDSEDIGFISKIDLECLYSDYGQISKSSFVDKILDFISKNSTTESFDAGKNNSNKTLEILAAIPFFFWIPYIMKKKSKNVIFLANNSFKLFLLFMINSLVLLLFELLPFIKTVSFEQNGILNYASVRYIPTIAVVIISLLFIVWGLLIFLNICCAIKNRLTKFLPFKSLEILK